MAKLLRFLDAHLLQILVGFLIIFIPLYPKLPLVGIPHTWVYVRLEDIFVAISFFWWGIQFLRKKYNLNTPLTWAIILYWIAGGISLIFTLLFTGKHLANFFPNVALLHYLRRIEYLGIFFLAFSAVKSKKDIKAYLWILIFTLIGVIFYGFGQKLLGFPAFLTMNEEFAKGVPLYLAPSSRLSSTFAGHYDLAAYLMFLIAFLVAVFFGIKNIIARIGIFIISFFSLFLLLLTASRVSFLVYLIAISMSLWWSKKKMLIIPVIVASIVMMLLVSGVSDRFMKTIRVRQVVYDVETGKAIGTLEQAPDGSVTKNGKVYVPIATESKEDLPVGSGFIDLPPDKSGANEATSIATIKKPVPQSLKLSTVSAEIATISGSFLIKKALVYDISFTTRFQGEWPRAIAAFLTNPLVGTGYSSIGLSDDNDYLRMLAETGIVGTLTFLFIFFCLGTFLRKTVSQEDDSLIKGAGIGLAGGLAGLSVNAVMIDIFEASKVAFSIWIIAGIVLGSLALSLKNKINYKEELKKLFRWFSTSDTALIFTLALGIFIVFSSSLSVYFLGDDFTWLKWVADADPGKLSGFFTEANGFFYRPLGKLFYYGLYNIFWLQPQGYHVLSVLIHIINTALVYLIVRKLLKNKFAAFISSALFGVMAIHGESLFWIAASAEMIAPLFGLLSFYFYLKNWKILSLIFLFPALLGHEGMIVFPLIFVLYDLLVKRKKELIVYLVCFVELGIYLFARNSAHAHWFNGDYSYNLVNLPFNSIGNFISYIAGMLIGTQALNSLENLRLFVKDYKSLLIGSIVIILSVVIIIFKYLLSRKKPENNILLFSAMTLVISFIPYLGLGNATGRYAYFPSVWLVVILACLFVLLLNNLQTKVAAVLSLVIFLILIGVNYQNLKNEEKDWIKAGKITYTTLAAVRNNFLYLPKGSTFYVNNLPIRYGKAWVFPVGFDDALWYVLGDKTLKIVKVGSIDSGLELQKNTVNGYVITFENFEIKEVK